jgi:hypothetical protein
MIFVHQPLVGSLTQVLSVRQVTDLSELPQPDLKEPPSDRGTVSFFLIRDSAVANCHQTWPVLALRRQT